MVVMVILDEEVKLVSLEAFKLVRLKVVKVRGVVVKLVGVIKMQELGGSKLVRSEEAVMMVRQ